MRRGREQRDLEQRDQQDAEREALRRQAWEREKNKELFSRRQRARQLAASLGAPVDLLPTIPAGRLA